MSAPGSSSLSLLKWDNGFQLASSAAVTAVVIIFVLFPVTLRPPKKFFPRAPEWLSFTFDFGWAPVVGCCVLAAMRVLTVEGIVAGLRGNDAIKPWSIIIIFFGLAYISISFDCTGAFEFLALLAVKKSGKSASKLFFYFWLVTSVVTVTASNDVAILTITPIIIHFTKRMNLNQEAFLLTEFMAANIWSMTLFIGNPTNIIVGIAYKMSFLGYTLWMGIPAICCGVLHFLMMRLIMNKSLPAELDVSKIGPVNPFSAIRTKWGAAFGCLTMGSCITLLCVSYWLKVELWLLCAAFCGLYLIHDVCVDLFCRKSTRHSHSAAALPVPLETVGNATLAQEKDLEAQTDAKPALLSVSKQLEETEAGVPEVTKKTTPEFVAFLKSKLSGRFPTLYEVLGRMPWKILPFVLGMFVLVQCLKDVGWVGHAAQAIVFSSRSSFVLSVFVSTSTATTKTKKQKAHTSTASPPLPFISSLGSFRLRQRS